MESVQKIWKLDNTAKNALTLNYLKKGGEKMNIKKLLMGISLFSLVLFLLVSYSSGVKADDKRDDDRGDRNNQEDNNHNGRGFNPGKELSKSACGEKLGDPVINVSQKVQNDVDSGFAGNYWAFDYYTRNIKVWEITTPGEGTSGIYCAIVVYNGKFYAVPGQIGPGNNPVGALINTPTDAPVNGNMSGGYRDIITGNLRTTPINGWPINGNVGTTNYQCNLSGICPGIISWRDTYFSSFSLTDEPWWGWQYKGGSHGTWVNAIDVSQPVSGNIL